MVRTRDYATKEEALEAWNTWAGRPGSVSRESFNRLNESVERDYPIQDGKLVMPDAEHAFGDIVIDSNGGYEHPWPRIYFSDYSNSKDGLYMEDDMFVVYKLRARWRLVERDHIALRELIKQLLIKNDKNNNLLNEQLNRWNDTLAGSGFPLFRENDLRGMDLSGLSIVPQGSDRVWLRHVDLSYTESHLLQMQNVNMYGAQCVGMRGTKLDLQSATAHGVVFRCSFIPNARFAGADLGYCNFSYALLSHAVFDGANCHGADFTSTNLWKASFDSYIDLYSEKRVFTDLSCVKWNADTSFAEVLFNDFLTEQNKALADHILEIRCQKTFSKQLASAIEMKPGIFGFSLDLSKIFGGLKAAWKAIKKKIQ